MVSAENLIANSRREPPSGDQTARPIESARITRKKVAAASPSKRSSKRATNRLRNPFGLRRILIVDDVADVTEMIALFLKHAGFDVATANSAHGALQLIAENQFDLIISDIGMPEMNGYDLAVSLRQQEGYEVIPMIAVTGYTEYDDRGRSLAAGFNAHLTKPINPAHLLNIVGELLA